MGHSRKGFTEVGARERLVWVAGVSGVSEEILGPSMAFI